MLRVLLVLFLLVPAPCALPYLGQARADELACGSLQNAFGPYDYRDATKGKELYLVESAHFTSDVQMLRRGFTSALPINDLDYTLRAFPNHIYALDSVTRYELQGGKMLSFWSAECYLDRAIRFAPDDGRVRMMQGLYFTKRGRMDDAQRALEEAERLMPTSVDVTYNLGLLYLKRNDFDKALAFAKKAYAAGYPLPGLREALRKKGYWQE